VPFQAPRLKIEIKGGCRTERKVEMISSFGTRFVRRLWIASVAALFISLAAKSAYACTYSPATPWFNENVSLLNTNRPSGILIAQDGHTVSLTNNLDTSSFYFNGYNGPKELGKSVQYSSDNNVLLANDNYVASLEPRNKAEDGRPADVKPPEPQDTTVELWLDQKPYSLHFRISYELNPDYTPSQLRAWDSSCEGFSLFDLGFNFPGPLFVIAILILLILMLTFIVLLKKYKALGK